MKYVLLDEIERVLQEMETITSLTNIKKDEDKTQIECTYGDTTYLISVTPIHKSK